MIRLAKENDIHEVVKLFRLFMRDMKLRAPNVDFEPYINTAISSELSLLTSYYKSSIGNSFWVADVGNVVGMVGIEKSDAETAELRRLIVDSDSRQSGVGTALLLQAETYCRDIGYRCIVLETAEFQTEAISLYKKHGYDMCSVSHNRKVSHKSAGSEIVRLKFHKDIL